VLTAIKLEAGRSSSPWPSPPFGEERESNPLLTLVSFDNSMAVGQGRGASNC